MVFEEPDENGNEWVEGAVPGGLDIAHVMVEVLAEKGWGKTWADCEGLRICPRVRVWLDGFQDWDFERVFLLRVWTDSEPYETTAETDPYGVPSTRTLTLTDHLAVYEYVKIVNGYAEGHAVDVEWRNDPRLFFDAGGDWSVDGLHWWVDKVQAMADSRRDGQDRDREIRRQRAGRKPNPEALASLEAHNRSVTERDQDQARRMGLHLPYLSGISDSR